MRPVTLAIMPENTEQKVADGWTYARQRDFTGGESLAKLPEAVAQNQLIKMVNAIISPEGLITEAWQMDTPLFINVTTGIVVVPIPGSKLFTVYAAAGEYVVSFTFDPNSSTPYDLADASGYPGYRLLSHAAPVTISGITHGTPFLGKNYCIAATSLYIDAGQLTTDPASLDFGTVQTRTVNMISMTVTNTTAGDISLTGVTFEGAGSGSYGHSGALPHVLAAAGEYTFNVVFNPTAEATDVATLNLINTIGILQVPLTGTAGSNLSVVPSNYDFGTIRQTLSTAGVDLRVSNAGTVAATVQSVQFEGDGSGNLSNTPALPYNSVVPAGGFLDIPIVFTGNTTGVLSASARMVTDLGTVTAELSGVSAPLPVLTQSSPSFVVTLAEFADYGSVILTLSNPGPGDVVLQDVVVTSESLYIPYIVINGVAVWFESPYPVTIPAGQFLDMELVAFGTRRPLPADVEVITDVITLNAHVDRGY